MIRPASEPPRGILSRSADADGIRYERLAPLPHLKDFIAHFWMVRWDRRGKSAFVAETLPHPCVLLVFEKGSAEVAGVQTRLFHRQLRGTGQVFGIKFRPAAFHPFFGAPVSRLTDRMVSVRSLFGSASTALAASIHRAKDMAAAVHAAEAFLEERLPTLPPSTAALRDLVERLAVDQTITRVEQVARLLEVDVRSLQRSFRAAVGVSPKWVIQRYRLHEAAEQLVHEKTPDLARLALHLGYFDQPHFIRSFKALIGRAPGAYALQQAAKPKAAAAGPAHSRMP